jgi:hemerythrin-like domain-containing protein
MDAIRQLEEDHRALREILGGVERAMKSASRAGDVARPCAVLAARLRMHMRRESQLAVLCDRVIGQSRSDALAPLDVEHDPEQLELHALLRGLRRDQPAASGALRESLERLAAWLRRHMREQEEGLFPFLEQVFWGRREAVDAARLTVVRRWTEGRTRLHATKLEGVKDRR